MRVIGGTMTDRSVRIEDAMRFGKLGLAAALAGALLAGCKTTSESGEVTQTEKSITERILFANTKLPEQKEAVVDYGCPSASILDGTAAYRVGGDTARGISHQAAIHDIARECKAQGNTMHVKVGVQGRLLLGENGKPGTFTIPVRVAVRSNGQTVYSKLVPTTVTIPPSDTQAAFVTIDDGVSLPITAEDPASAYTILVGLDPQGAKVGGGGKKRRR